MNWSEKLRIFLLFSKYEYDLGVGGCFLSDTIKIQKREDSQDRTIFCALYNFC